LIVHSLLGDPPIGHQAATMTHRRAQGIHCRRISVQSPRPLTSQIR
jgi:hypothetical protein